MLEASKGWDGALCADERITKDPQFMSMVMDALERGVAPADAALASNCALVTTGVFSGDFTDEDRMAAAFLLASSLWASLRERLDGEEGGEDTLLLRHGLRHVAEAAARLLPEGNTYKNRTLPEDGKFLMHA